MPHLKIEIEYDESLDRLVFTAREPPFERQVRINRGEPWDKAIELIQEAWRRWRHQ